MPSHNQPSDCDPIAGLEAELLPRIAAGNRLPATNDVRLSYARARMRREIQAQHAHAAWRTRPWATLAPALAAAAALWAALAGLLATHPIAAAGLAVGLIVSGGVAADVTNVGPPLLENVGLQHATVVRTDTPGADHRSTTGVDALQQAESAALGSTGPNANANGADSGSDPTANPPTDTHGATIAPIARSNDDPSLDAANGAQTHGDIVSCTAAAQGQTASAAAQTDNRPPDTTPATGVSQACDDHTAESTTSPNNASGQGMPNNPGANRNTNATDRPGNRPTDP